MTDQTDTVPAPEAPVAAKSTETAPAEQAPPAPEPVPQTTPGMTPAEADASIKSRLEHVIAGKEVTVTFKGRKLVFRRWGLRQNLRMGSRVMKLIKTIKSAVPELSNTQLLTDVGVLTQILSFVADDVLEIVAGSISAPFTTADEAEAWLDDNVEDVEDLFDLAYVVYEQNLKGDGLGKLTSGMEGLTKKMASLSMSSSKS